MTILISPAEPAEIKHLLGDRALSHSLPERLGADFLAPTLAGKVAIQRKTVSDLLRSLEDGRLMREVALLRRTEHPFLLVEGELQFTSEGNLLAGFNSRYTRSQIRNLLRSVGYAGVLVERTTGQEDTVTAVLEIADYHKKKHKSMDVRPKMKNDWGSRTDRDWAMILLQSFPGIGAVMAGQIFDHFGEIPLAWMCGKQELMEVEGIGPKRADGLWRSLERKVR